MSDKFLQPLDGIATVSRAMNDDALAAAASRVRAGENLADVALELAIEETVAEEDGTGRLRVSASGPTALAFARERRLAVLAAASLRMAALSVNGAESDADTAAATVAKALGGRALRDILADAHEAGQDLALGGLRAAKKGAREASPAMKRAAAWAEEHAAELVKGVSETTRDQVRFVIARLLDQDVPLSSREARDLIAEAVGGKARAQLIARTETMAAVNAGQRAGWQAAVNAGELQKSARRVWIVAADEAECDECRAMDGRKARIGEAYANGLEGPPAHPNCRCTEGLA